MLKYKILKKIIATWMIVLIVTIPLYSSTVLGAFLTNTDAQGQDTQIKSVINNEENIVVKTTANKDGQPVTGNELYLGTQEMFAGNDFISGGWSCSGGPDYDCTFIPPADEDYSIVGDYMNFIVKLGSPSNPLATAYAPICLDTSKPEIKNMQILSDRLISSDGSIIVSYTIGDSANSNVNCRSKCSGIKKIVVYKCDALGSGKTIAINTNNCDYSKINEEILISQITTATGNIKLCAYAVDNFDNNEDSSNYTEIGDITADSEGPRINGYMQVKDSEGMAITAARAGMDVTVEVDVHDDAGIAEVKADLTRLNSAAGNDVVGQCTPSVSNIPKPKDSMCRWPVTLQTTNENLEVTVKAKDVFGHEATVVAKKTIGIDNVPPRILSLKTEPRDNVANQDYVSSNARFVAEIIEENGLNKRDLFTAPLTEAIYTSADCIRDAEVADRLVCTWNFEVTKSQHGENETVYIPPYGICDAVGNCNDGSYPATGLRVTVDKRAPDVTVRDVNITSDLNLIENRYIGSSRIAVTAHVRDDSGVSAVGNFKDAVQPVEGADREHIKADCSGADGEWECVWNEAWMRLHVVEGQRQITLQFRDSAGNPKSITVPITITKPDMTVGDIEISSNEYAPIEEDRTYLVGTSTLNINAKVRTIGAEGDTHITAKADFREIRGEGVETLCSAPSAETEWYSICHWDTNGLSPVLRLPKEPPYFITINFEFSDQLGNRATASERVWIKTPALVLVEDGIAWTQEGLLPLIGTTEMPPHLKDYVVGGLGAVFTAKVININDNDAIVTAKADFSALVNQTIADEWKDVEVSCSFTDAEQDYWQCAWPAVPVLNQHSEKIIKFHFEDGLGNSLDVEKTIKIIKIADVETDYWGIEGVTTIPPRIDRQTAPLFSQRAYFKIKLRQKVEDITTLAISKHSCNGYPVAGEDSENSLSYIEGGEIHLMNDYPGSKEPWLYVNLETGNTIDFDVLKFNCTLSIVTKEGDRFISLPEYENFPDLTIEFYNMPLGEMSAGLQSKVDSSQDFIFKVADKIEFLNGLMVIFQRICTLIDLLHAIDKLVAIIAQGVDAVVCTIPGGQGISVRVTQSSAKLNKLTQGMTNKLYKYCKFLSCTEGGGMLHREFLTDINKNLPDVPPSWKDAVGIWADSELKPATIRESMILSMATMCVPGIIYNLHKYKQIQCSYVLCIKNAVAMGASPAFCDKGRSYLICKFWIGEVFQVIPFVAFFNNLFDVIKTLLANPINLIMGYTIQYCYRGVCPNSGPVGSTTCVITYALLVIGEIKADLEALKGNLEWNALLKTDICEEAGI